MRPRPLPVRIDRSRARGLRSSAWASRYSRSTSRRHTILIGARRSSAWSIPARSTRSYRDPVLERLGITPHDRQRFRLADGSTIERARGDAIFFYAGRRGAAPVIFAEPGDAVLLGAVTLESLGLVLDAVRRDLVPLPMIIAPAVAA